MLSTSGLNLPVCDAITFAKPCESGDVTCTGSVDTLIVPGVSTAAFLIASINSVGTRLFVLGSTGRAYCDGSKPPCPGPPKVAEGDPIDGPASAKAPRVFATF